jgi:aspartyl aminopeptidase
MVFRADADGGCVGCGRRVVQALLESVEGDAHATDAYVRVIALFDNEEVGSESAHGAASLLFASLLRRLSTSATNPVRAHPTTQGDAAEPRHQHKHTYTQRERERERGRETEVVMQGRAHLYQMHS